MDLLICRNHFIKRTHPLYNISQSHYLENIAINNNNEDVGLGGYVLLI